MTIAAVPDADVRTFEAVLEQWTHDEVVLRRHGQHALADQLAQCAADVRAGAEEFLTLLAESEAALYSGETARWLQKRFPALERRGLALKRGRTRYYRQCAIPRRAETARAFEAGRDAARRTKSA